MRLLVAGGDRVDAGKTTFSTGLLAYADAVGFKPRAGNDYWFDHDDYERAVDDGRLYGKDAKRLAAASASDVAPEAINPLHRLWRPSHGTGSGLVGAGHREFVLDRVTVDGADEYVVHADADVPPSARERLPLADATVVDSLPAFNDVMRDLHADALSSVAGSVRECERVVVESYGDVAVPLADVAFDAVAVVDPGRARVYDGDRYLKARSVVGGTAREGRLEETTGDVLEHCDPQATVSLPALASDDRADPEAVADAYELAYDALVSIALA
ncbi:ATPase [Halorubellus sp. JP-L1]|uniref:ATPase n=1 Tax=Halorubellus sp. JP-L1 TaxID=2715753 RepID=UPI00140AE9D7|nr:ATPase [Halorubellus sp. JP-L1]NHN41006.1 ATPase [Halorubellus sp. JP-L1]